MGNAYPARAVALVAVIAGGCASSSRGASNVPSDGGGSSGGDGGIVGGDGGVVPADATSEGQTVTRTPDPCIAAGTCAPGTWVDVTPTSINLTGGACGNGNYGTKIVQVDPIRASDLYSVFPCQGVWKSADYGATWTGPLAKGTSATMLSDCAGVMSIARSASNPDAILYLTCELGSNIGFWRSTNGGADWTNYPALPNGGQANAVNQQFYAPAVDPYDANHLIMAEHQADVVVESTDGGQTWTGVTFAQGMAVGDGGTGGINFVNTGVAATTRTTWLWIAAAISISNNVGTVGTWRTADGGKTWKNVDKNEHTNGSMHSEVFQPPPYNSGVVFMAGGYSALGSGVLRSSDFGVTWTHVGQAFQEGVVVGTSKHLYSMFGWAAGPGAQVDPMLEVGDATGMATWTSPGTPASMTQGPGQLAVTNDGTYNIIFAGNYNAGIWRYVEPTN
jgi:hypothetical protein